MQVPPGYRMLPDGTLLNETTGMVEAPVVDDPRPSATAGPTHAWSPKRAPSPAAGSGNGLIVPGGANPQIAAIAGIPGMGQDAATPTPQGLTPMRKILCIGAIVAVAAATVWLQNRTKTKGKK